MNKTLFKYIFKMQLKALVFVAISVFFLILLFDFAEITRKFPISNTNETIFAIKLSFLRTPSTFCEVLHYVYFVTATFSLWDLCRSHQITILKSTGQSPQQILYPFICCALCIAAIWLFILHPIGRFSAEIYNKLSNNAYISEANNDIWVDYSKNNQLIFIKSINEGGIDGLYIFNTKNNDRLFARHATVENKIWNLHDVTVIKQNKIKTIEGMKIFNGISFDLIKLLSKAPSKQNIYSLYKIYKIQGEDKISLKLYELELHKLLVNCVNFILFALIAAVICFPINRYKTKTNIAIKVISTAIILRFSNNMFESLAYTGIISVQLACWAIVLILLCITVAILIWKEA